jgi:hypothetical protein
MVCSLRIRVAESRGWPAAIFPRARRLGVGNDSAIIFQNILTVRLVFAAS